MERAKMLRKFSLLFFIILCLATNLCANAEEVTDMAPPNWSKNWPEVYAQKNEEISSLWTESLAAFDTKDWTLANHKILELVKICEELDISEIPEYSQILLTYAEAELKNGDKQSAAFIIRKAREISPKSFSIALEASHFNTGNSDSGRFQALWELAKLFIARTDHIFVFVKSFIYPALWAVTISLSLAYIMFLAANVSSFLSALALLMPSSSRGLLSIMLLGAFLLLPPLFGPIWMLSFWALMTLAFLPKNRWLVGLTAILIVSWGALAPIRENMNAWLSKEGTQRVLRIQSGVYARDDEKNILLLINERVSDPSLKYTLAQLLKRRGDYKSAEGLFASIKNDISNSQKIDMQLASIYYLIGDYSKASKLFDTLEKEGLSSAEFNFNYSKVLFELTDTELSRAKFELANSNNPSLIKNLQKKEEIVGMQHPVSMAETNLSYNDLFRASLVPIEGTNMMADKILLRIMPGGNCMLALAIGGGLMLLFLVRLATPAREWRRIYFSNYKHSPLFYGVIRLIPGGSAILNGTTVRAVIILSLLILLIIPIIEWPRDAHASLDIFRELKFYYIYSVSFIVAAFCYIGFHSYEGKTS
jgi:tetratricopeptide (TPR) repeat protein